MSNKSVFFLAALAFLASPARGEEGGSGHYVPGSMASFADAVPPDETFVTRYNMLYYEGAFRPDRPLPIAALSTAGAEVESWAHGLTLLWRPPLDLGAKRSYAMSATIPFVQVDVSAELSTAGGASLRRSDELSGLGDIVLMPLMLNYVHSPDLSTNFRLGFYAPTGDYEVGRLANTGKNYWTIEPTLALVYSGQKNGREATLFAGVDFNTENEDTDYHSGTQVHLDSTLAQHFPLSGGFAGVGVSGSWYRQVEGDSGSGATLGDFKARTSSLGPVLSYACLAGELAVVAELKWLHEVETTKRLKGDYVWLKVMAKF
jgi:hypothetical protein